MACNDGRSEVFRPMLDRLISDSRTASTDGNPAQDLYVSLILSLDHGKGVVAICGVL
jgi:hypothetical protein